MSSYDDWKTDPEFGMSEADLKIAELEAENDGLVNENHRLENKLDEAKTIGNDLIIEAVAKQGEIERLRAALEEALETCQDQYDVEDGDDGRPLPNRWMKLGTMIEEALKGRG